jgi:hypothetical protein
MHAARWVDHGSVYSLPGGIYTKGVEEFFSRMRRDCLGLPAVVHPPPVRAGDHVPSMNGLIRGLANGPRKD